MEYPYLGSCNVFAISVLLSPVKGLQLKDEPINANSLKYSDGDVLRYFFWEGCTLNIVNPTLFPNKWGCTLMCVCGAIFAMRHLLTIYILIPRSLSMEDIFVALGALLSTVFWSFTYNIESQNNMELNFRQTLITFAGFAIFIGGMIISTGSELQRKSFKRPGRLVTQGLWSFSMHINYFGEFLYYLGWSLITLQWYNLWVPFFMLIGFVCWHIPGLDEYLEERYPEQFPDYAKKTKKLIPYIY